jgi:hypothetical protein
MISPALRASVPDRLWNRRWKPARPIRMGIAVLGALFMGPAAAALAHAVLALGVLP